MLESTANRLEVQLVAELGGSDKRQVGEEIAALVSQIARIREQFSL